MTHAQLAVASVLVVAVWAVAADPVPIATGRVELATVAVSARTTGVVAKVMVTEGQAVKKGDLLAELSDAEAKAGLDATTAKLRGAEAKLKLAEAELKLATQDIERLKKVGEAVSQQELERAATVVESKRTELEVRKAELELAQADVALAKLTLSATRIVSPADGRVDRVPLTAGNIDRADQDVIVRLLPAADPVIVVTVGEAAHMALRERAVMEKERVTAAVGFVGEKGHPHPLNLLPNAEFDDKTKTVVLRGTLTKPKAELSQGEPVRVELSVTPVKPEK